MSGPSVVIDAHGTTYADIVLLTEWMAERGEKAADLAYAIEKPWKYADAIALARAIRDHEFTGHLPHPSGDSDDTVWVCQDGCPWEADPQEIRDCRNCETRYPAGSGVGDPYALDAATREERDDAWCTQACHDQAAEDWAEAMADR